MKIINHIVAFSLEICMLVILCLAGINQSETILWQWILGIGFPLIAVLLWARWAAPRSSSRLRNGERIAFKFVLFSITAFFLSNLSNEWAALAFWIIALSSLILEYSLERSHNN